MEVSKEIPWKKRARSAMLRLNLEPGDEMALAKGTASLAVGIDEKLLAELRAFVERRGEKIREVVEVALRRHMANPPPPPAAAPPLPPVVYEVKSPVSAELVGEKPVADKPAKPKRKK